MGRRAGDRLIGRRLGDALPGARLGDALLGAMAAGILALAAAVAVQVAANAADLNPLVTFEREWPLVGGAVTLNSLLDLQWHLLAAVALLPAGVVWLRDRHVRVDVVQSRLAPRGKAAVDLAGNVVFALPFLWFALPAAWGFAARSWGMDEGSANGGLVDLWLVKGVLPLGLGLLAGAVAWESARLARALAR